MSWRSSVHDHVVDVRLGAVLTDLLLEQFSRQPTMLDLAYSTSAATGGRSVGKTSTSLPMLRLSSSNCSDAASGTVVNAPSAASCTDRTRRCPWPGRMLSACVIVDEGVEPANPAGKSATTKAPARAIAASPAACDAAATARRCGTRRPGARPRRKRARRPPESRAHRPQCMGSTRRILDHLGLGRVTTHPCPPGARLGRGCGRASSSSCRCSGGRPPASSCRARCSAA